MRRGLIALLLTLLATTTFAATKPVDIVVTGGTVLTMAGPNIEHGAVAIDGGKIIAVGKAADIARQYAGKSTIRPAAPSSPASSMRIRMCR